MFSDLCLPAFNYSHTCTRILHFPFLIRYTNFKPCLCARNRNSKYFGRTILNREDSFFLHNCHWQGLSITSINLFNNNNGRFTTVVVVELLLNASKWQKQVKIYNLRNRFFAKNHLFHKQIRDFFISLTSLWIKLEIWCLVNISKHT